MYQYKIDFLIFFSEGVQHTTYFDTCPIADCSYPPVDPSSTTEITTTYSPPKDSDFLDVGLPILIIIFGSLIFFGVYIKFIRPRNNVSPEDIELADFCRYL